MRYLLLVIGLSGIITAGILAYRIVMLFFKIEAKIKNRPQMNLLREWINIDYSGWFKGHYFDIFPISFFLHLLDKERYSVFSNDVQVMFRQKFKYEMYFWAIFLFGLLLIPVSQILIK